MRCVYPIDLAEAPDGVTITSPLIPELITCGDTRVEALARAEDALVSALSFYVDEDRPLLSPPPNPGLDAIAVPALQAAKLALHDAIITAGSSDVELARHLGIDEKAVRRLRDPLHRSHIAQLEAALSALGHRLTVEIERSPSLAQPGLPERLVPAI